MAVVLRPITPAFKRATRKTLSIALHGSAVVALGFASTFVVALAGALKGIEVGGSTAEDDVAVVEFQYDAAVLSKICPHSPVARTVYTYRTQVAWVTDKQVMVRHSGGLSSGETSTHRRSASAQCVYPLRLADAATSRDEYQFGWPRPALWASSDTWHMGCFMEDLGTTHACRLPFSGQPSQNRFSDRPFHRELRDGWYVPTGLHWRGIAANTAVLASMWCVPLIALPYVRRAIRRRRAQCTACAYSREGLHAGVPCPECGLTPNSPGETTIMP